STMEWQALERGRQPAKKDKAQTLRLLAIRDSARELIEAQREGSSVEHRDQLRERLRGQWESYTEAYGPISQRKELWKTPKQAQQLQIRRELAGEWLAENQPETDSDQLDNETLDELITPSEDSPVPVEVAQQWAEQAKERQVAGYSQPHL